MAGTDPEIPIIEYTFSEPRIEEQTSIGGSIVSFVIIEVGNNLGLPTYTEKIKYQPNLGYTKKGILSSTKQKFTQKPPQVPGNEFEGQTYPENGSEVEFIYDLDPLPYTLKGTVVNGNNLSPIPGAYIEDNNGFTSKSDTKGSFKISGEYYSDEVTQIALSKEEYETTVVSISNQDGSIKNNIIAKLPPSNPSPNKSLLKSQAISEEEIKRLSTEEQLDVLETISNNVTDKIKKRIIPFIIKKLLCKPFKICDPLGLIDQAQDAYLKSTSYISEFEEYQPEDVNVGFQRGDEEGRDNFINDFTFSPTSTFIPPSSDEMGGTSPDITTDGSGDDDDPSKEVRFKTPRKRRRFRLFERKPKATILKRGKFRKKGNRRVRNKNINFSGRKRRR